MILSKMPSSDDSQHTTVLHLWSGKCVGFEVRSRVGRPLLKVSEMIKFLNLTESYLAQFKDGDNNAYLAVITWLRTNIYIRTVPSILSCAVQGSYTKSA